MTQSNGDGHLDKTIKWLKILSLAQAVVVTIGGGILVAAFKYGQSTQIKKHEIEAIQADIINMKENLVGPINSGQHQLQIQLKAVQEDLSKQMQDMRELVLQFRATSEAKFIFLERSLDRIEKQSGR